MDETLNFNLSDLENKSLSDLQELASQLGATNGTPVTRKDELITRILTVQTDRNGLIHAKGILEILQDGWGFLRRSNFSPNAEDIYVSQTQIKRFGLKTGDEVAGQVRPPKDSEKYFGLLRVEGVNGVDPDVARNRVNFDDLTPIYPKEMPDAGNHTRRNDRAHHGLDFADWQRAARHDCGTAQSRQNNRNEDHCQLHCGQSPGVHSDCPAD